MRRIFSVLSLLIFGLPGVPQALGQSSSTNYEPRVVLRQPLPAITDAPFVKAGEAPGQSC